MNNYNIDHQKSQQVIKRAQYIKHVIQGDICDSTYLSFVPKVHIRKISRNLYIKLKYKRDSSGHIIDEVYSDGEVFEMSDNPDRNARSLRKIFKDLRQLIATNFTPDSEKQLFVTLTYAENMQDEKQAYKDYDRFWKRLKYAMPDHNLNYISIVEPQGRGAWHIHMLLKSDKPLYDDYETKKKLYDIWGNGLTYTEKLNNVDHIGAYFIAYFTNAEIPEDKLSEYRDDIVEKNGKKVIKGERLKFYPDYMKIYRNSRGIVKPKKNVYNANLTYDTHANKNQNEENIKLNFPVVTHRATKEINTGLTNAYNKPIQLEIQSTQRKRINNKK